MLVNLLMKAGFILVKTTDSMVIQFLVNIRPVAIEVFSGTIIAIMQFLLVLLMTGLLLVECHLAQLKKVGTTLH